MKEEIEILKNLVKFNTVKDKENEGIINYIENYLSKLGFETEYKGKYLIMRIGKESKIGFIGHTDTICYTEGWNTNPFELTEKDGNLYGLGACDMKSGIATALAAAKRIDFNKLKSGMKMYFTYDEETGFSGIKEIIARNEKFPPNMLIGEPTDNVPRIGSKGIIEYKINFKGIRGHASRTDESKNAICKCIKFINEIEKFYKEEIKKIENDMFKIPYTTMNIGKIEGGDSINSVAENCTVLFDFRIVDEKIIEMVKEKINDIIKKYEGEAIILNELKPLIQLKENTDRIIKKDLEEQFEYGITEASFINSNKVIIGPGLCNSFAANENLPIKNLEEAVDIYVEIINRICG